VTVKEIGLEGNLRGCAYLQDIYRMFTASVLKCSAVQEHLPHTQQYLFRRNLSCMVFLWNGWFLDESCFLHRKI